MRTLLRIAAGLLLFTTPALAAPGHLIVSADLDRGVGVQLDGVDGFTGVGARVGYGLDLKLLELIPEARVMMYREPDSGFVTGEAGGRIMFFKILEPGVFARLVVPVGSGGPGPGFTAGGLLDFTAIPKIDIGVHGGALIGAKGAAGLVGAHLTLNL